jgi:release factor glutamine methyltransferase
VFLGVKNKYPSSEISTLQSEIRKFEPIIALDGGPDGLKDICFLLQETHNYLKNKGFFLMEIGHDQKPAIEDILLNSK